MNILFIEIPNYFAFPLIFLFTLSMVIFYLY